MLMLIITISGDKYDKVVDFPISGHIYTTTVAHIVCNIQTHNYIICLCSTNN